MAPKEFVAVIAIFCCIYIVFLCLILAIGILSRLDPVYKFNLSNFISYTMDYHMINMGYL